MTKKRIFTATDAQDAVGALLQSARKSAGLSQTDVAELLGVCQNLISHYERGRHLSIDTIAAYAAAFDLHLTCKPVSPARSPDSPA